MRTESVRLFRDEFAREFVKRGSYKFADEPAPDVLLVVPAIEELNILAPEAGDAAGERTYLTGRPVTMKVTGDMRDAMTGKVVGRVITYHPPEQNPYNELRIANRVDHGPGAAPRIFGMVAHRARSNRCSKGGKASGAEACRNRFAE